MITRSRFLFCFFIALCCISCACAPAPTPEAPKVKPTDQQIIETPTEAAPQEADTPATGIIQGGISVDKSFSGPIHLYAQEISTSKWEALEVLLVNGKGSYQFEIFAGSYKIFFHSDLGVSGGFTITGTSLKTIVLKGGETASGIEALEVVDSDCGPLFGIPASPDGMFTAVEGADKKCLADLADAMT